MATNSVINKPPQSLVVSEGSNQDYPIPLSLKLGADESSHALVHLEKLGYPEGMQVELQELKFAIIGLKKQLEESQSKNIGFLNVIGSLIAIAILIPIFIACIAAVFIVPIEILNVTTVGFLSGLIKYSVAIASPVAVIIIMSLIGKAINRIGGHDNNKTIAINEKIELEAKNVVYKASVVEKKARRIPKYDNPEFKCISDNNKCMEYNKDSSYIQKCLCALAFATCIARSLIPFARIKH